MADYEIDVTPVGPVAMQFPRPSRQVLAERLKRYQRSERVLVDLDGDGGTRRLDRQTHRDHQDPPWRPKLIACVKSALVAFGACADDGRDPLPPDRAILILRPLERLLNTTQGTRTEGCPVGLP